MESKEVKEKEPKELRVVLEPEIFDKIEVIKDYYGIKNMTELIRFLITKTERKIQTSIINHKEKQLTIDQFDTKFKDFMNKQLKDTE